MQSSLHLGKTTVHKEQTSQVKGFSAFLCRGRCKSLASLKFFLRYASNDPRSLLVQSTDRPSCFLPTFLSGCTSVSTAVADDLICIFFIYHKPYRKGLINVMYFLTNDTPNKKATQLWDKEQYPGYMSRNQSVKRQAIFFSC